MARSAAFSVSEADYKRLQAVAKYRNKTVSTFMRDLVWPHVELAEHEIEHADEIADQIRKEYKAGGLSKQELGILHNKSTNEINAILAGR